jgi:hypothetical protein
LYARHGRNLAVKTCRTTKEENMKSYATFAATLLLLTIAASGLYAQNVETDPDNGKSASPTNIGTSGRFKTAIDDFISPQDYSGLKLNNWFGYVSWANPFQPQLGFAKQINNIYLALYYKGTLWGGFNNFAGKEEIVPTFMGGADDKKLTTYDMPAPLDYPDNSVAVLFGFADMGIRLGFSSTYDSFKSDGDMRYVSGVASGVTTYNNYKSYVVENGNLVPQIKWGMAKDLIKQGIRPYATVTLNFHRENLKVDEYVETGGVIKTSGEKILYSQNYFQPTLAAGMGGFAFYNANGFKSSLDLDYTLRLIVYSNDYSYAKDTSLLINPNDYIYGTATIKGTWGPTSATDITPVLRERSNVFNSVVPSVSGSWSSGNLGLKAKFRVNLDFDSSKTTDMNTIRDDGITNGNLQKQGISEIRNVFTLTPRLDLGLQYGIIPDRLTLNTGGRLARGISYTTADLKEYDDYGNEDQMKASNSKSTSFGTMTWDLYASAMFNFSGNAWVEASTGVQSGVNIFSTGVNGLFNFTSIAVGLKF